MLTFLPIILFFYSHKLHLLFFSMHQLFSIMLTGFHTYAYKNDNNLKVFTISILAFLSGCVLALLKAACSPLKKILAVYIRNLLLHLVERDCKFAMFWPPDQESVPIMPA